MKNKENTIENINPLFYGMTLIRPIGRKSKDLTLKGFNTEVLQVLYVEQGLSAKEIAKLWGINENTLKAFIDKSNIRKRKQREPQT